MGNYCCGIYDQRPEMCKRYPEPGSYVPDVCTFYFSDGERKGSCDPNCNSSCCFLPRVGGEPGASPMPEIAGGEPCKHISYVSRHPALGDVPGERPTDPISGADREGDRPSSDAIELVLAAKRGSEGSGSDTP